MRVKSTTEGSAKRAVKFLAVTAVVLGAVAGQQAVAGIKDTKHNLGADNAVNENYMTSGTTEICVFCHTPHASNTAVSAPLWNKPVNGGSYTTYTTATSSTIDGGVSMGGVSLACLSCHDGTQAMDTMINQPGSGGYNSNGATLSGGVWTGANQTGGALRGIANLGTDLSNDHPVGIQYCGGGYTAGATSSGASSGTCKDPDFIAPSNALIANARVWFVDTTGGTANSRDKTDMVLYARNPTGSFTNSGEYQPFVECASCHDPHTTNATFLRISNTQSAVCLACHNK